MNNVVIGDLIRERRSGTIKISFDLFKYNLDMSVYGVIFSRVAIIGAENSFIDNTLTYRGVSPEFRPLAEGEKPPEYTIVVNGDKETGIVNDISFEEVTTCK